MVTLASFTFEIFAMSGIVAVLATLYAQRTIAPTAMNMIGLPAIYAGIEIPRPTSFLSVVMKRMFLTGHQRQIVQRVIKSITIDMVNLFMAFQYTAQETLHDQAMFGDVAARKPLISDILILRRAIGLSRNGHVGHCSMKAAW
jgi:hypothetical protein